jgi:hypothetical protein
MDPKTDNEIEITPEMIECAYFKSPSNEEAVVRRIYGVMRYIKCRQTREVAT